MSLVSIQKHLNFLYKAKSDIQVGDQPYTEWDPNDLKQRLEQAKRNVEEKRKGEEERRKRESDQAREEEIRRKKDDDLPPWVRY